MNDAALVNPASGLHLTPFVGFPKLLSGSLRARRSNERLQLWGARCLRMQPSERDSSALLEVYISAHYISVSSSKKWEQKWCVILGATEKVSWDMRLGADQAQHEAGLNPQRCN